MKYAMCLDTGARSEPRSSLWRSREPADRSHIERQV